MPDLGDHGTERGLDASAHGTGSISLGFVKIGGVDVAVPLDFVREVVARPAVMEHLLLSADLPVDAMEVRGVVVPVLDVRPGLGRPSGRTPSEDNVIIFARGTQTFGLLVEEITGIQRIPAEEIRPIHAADVETALLSHTFLHPRHGHVVSVIDVDRLMALPELPTVESRSAGTGPTAVAGVGTGRRHLTLFRCFDRVLAIDVADVHTVLPGAPAMPTPLAGGACLGVRVFDEREIAIVDPLALTGIGRFRADLLADGGGMVIAVNDGHVVLAITEPLDIVVVTSEEIRPVDPYLVHRPDLFDGMIEVDGFGICFVVDATRLRAEAPIPALASLTAHRDDDLATDRLDESDGSIAHDVGTNFLVYEIDTDHDGDDRRLAIGSKLDEIDEILPHRDLLPTSGHPSVLGVLSHRDRMIPVVCLSTLVGRRPIRRTSASCLLLVGTDAGAIAFAVDGLIDIAPLDRRFPPPACGGEDFDDSCAITLGTSTELRREACLPDLARRLTRPSPDASGQASDLHDPADPRRGELVAAGV